MKSIRLSLALVALALSGAAYATQPGSNGGGNASAGASAAAVAAAQANAAAIAAQRQAQRQQQAQGQRQTATGGRSTATGGNSGGNRMTGGSQAVTVEGDKGDAIYAPAQERAPVATAYAAPLTASNGTCMGSSSAGGQGSAFGLSFGTTWVDASCDARYDAEALRATGLTAAAQARLCQKPEIKAAMEAAGTPCTDKGQAKRADAAPNSTPVASASQAQYQDPIIRARLGLPPLK